MELLATLRRSGGIDALARQVGLLPATVSPAVEALLPALLEGMSAYAQRLGGGDAGVRAMLAVVDGLGDGNLAVEVMGPGPLSDESGNRILALIFGTNDARQRWVDAVGKVRGQDPALLDRLLPALAMLVCGYFSARVRADDTDGESIAWLRELLLLRDPGESKAGFGTG